MLGLPTAGWDDYPGENLPYVWPHQIEIANLLVRRPEDGDKPIRGAVASCHAIGKDWTAARVAVWFIASFPGSIVITTGPTDRQVKLLLWGEMHSAYHHAAQPLPGVMNTVDWKVADGHYAIGFKAKDQDPERFQGFHAKHLLYIVDEASGVDDRIFEGIEGGLSTGDARILLIGNPTKASGVFYQAFHQQAAIWRTIRIGATQTPNWLTEHRVRHFIQKEWAAERLKVWGADSALYQVRVMGQFPTVGLNTLISLADVEAARNSRYDPSLYPPQLLGGVQMGVDAARFGDDETALYIRRGPQVIHWESWGHRDLMRSAHRIRKLAVEFNVTTIRVDGTGLGAGIVDRLCEMYDDGQLPTDCAIHDIQFGAAPAEPEEYGLFRDELWFRLAQKFKAGEISDLPDDPVLQAQLTSVEYKFDRRDRLVVESKDDMKKRGLESPDRAEALALAFLDGGLEINASAQEDELVTREDAIVGNLWEKNF